MVRREVIGRVVLGAAAVIVLAWLAIMLRDVRIRADAQAGSLGALTADLHTTSGLRRRIDELRRSRLLDPDTAPQLQIASDLQVHGGAAALAQGLTIVQGVTRQEPQNLDAWIVQAAIDRDLGDASGAARAEAQILRLDPRIR